MNTEYTFDGLLHAMHDAWTLTPEGLARAALTYLASCAPVDTPGLNELFAGPEYPGLPEWRPRGELKTLRAQLTAALVERDKCIAISEEQEGRLLRCQARSKERKTELIKELAAHALTRAERDELRQR